MCRNVVFLSLFLAAMCCLVVAHSKYSEAMNRAGPPPNPNAEKKPFRMHKLNLLWEKAQKRLSDAKLKGLFADLKVQDKEELAWKKMMGQDKDGLKEAELRSKLKEIVDKFDLSDQFKHHQDEPPEHPNAARKEGYMFRDKKLNKLWLKVQKAGLSEEEMRTLREEFQHHQDKIDQFYATRDEDGKELGNDVELNVLAEEERQNGLLSGDVERQRHEALLESYRKLNSRADEAWKRKGGFAEDKVQRLWKLAQQGDFSPSELESLKEELQHYEHRIRKLNHFQTELEQHGADPKAAPDEDHVKTLKQRIKQYNHKVNKVHQDLEGRILQRHLEL
uniref:Putative alpha-2-macroglobulin receptor-associated protein n=1 Tax=Amblyomma cajennense TaxID=34607 RepID=A0A023FN45_AMBCJ